MLGMPTEGAVSLNGRRGGVDSGTRPEPTSSRGEEEASAAVVMLPAELGKVLGENGGIDPVLNAVTKAMVGSLFIEVPRARVQDSGVDAGIVIDGGGAGDLPGVPLGVSPLVRQDRVPPDAEEVGDGGADRPNNFIPAIRGG